MLLDILVGSVPPRGFEISWAVLYFLDCCVVLIATQTLFINAKRLVSFYSMYFAVRVGAIAQEKGGQTLGTVNITTIFVLLYYSFFVYIWWILISPDFLFSCWNHNWQ